MAVSVAKGFADQILASTQPGIILDEWLIERLIESGLPELTALDEAESVKPKLLIEIQTRVSLSISRGVTPAYLIDSGSGSLIRSDLAPNPAEWRPTNPELRAAIAGMCGSLSGKDFEYVCLYLLRLYGATKAVVRGGAGDGGVDVVALIDKPGERPSLERLRTKPMRVVCQAKLKVHGAVEHDTAAALAQRVGDIRAGGHIYHELPEWFRASETPIVGLLMTAGSVSQAARKSAAKSGSFVVEGDQVTEDLARSPSLDSWVVDGVPDLSKFRSLISSF